MTEPVQRPIEGGHDTLGLERERLELERAKLEVERFKAKLSAVAVAVPLFAIAATVGLGVWDQHEKAQDDFTVKAAEILLSSDNPWVTSNRARTLATLFPRRLPSGFAQSYRPESIPRDALEDQKTLLSQLAAQPAHGKEILGWWRAMFSYEEWLSNFDSAQRTGQTRR